MIPEAAQDVEVGHDLGLWLRPDARHPAGQGRSVELGPLGQGIQPPLPQDVLDVQAGAGTAEDRAPSSRELRSGHGSVVTGLACSNGK